MSGISLGSGSRRSLLAAAGLTGASLLSWRLAGAQTDSVDRVDEGDCTKDAGVELFFDLLNQPRILHDVPEYQPGPQWEAIEHPHLLQPLFMPPGWTAEWGVCTAISDDGEPTWEADISIDPSTTLAVSRLTAPRGEAVFENISGTIMGVALNMEQAQTVTRLSTVDADDRVRLVCGKSLRPTPESGVWQTGERIGLNTRVSTGLVFPVADMLSYTVIQAQSAITRRRDMEEALTTLFPLFVQCMPPPRRGGAGAEPTPSPTAEF
jgi:hypothetical protein